MRALRLAPERVPAEGRAAEIVSLADWPSVEQPVVPLVPKSAPSRARRLLSVIGHNPLAVSGGAILLFVALMGLTSPLLYPGDPLAIVAEPFIWPGTDAAHPLGTDSLGRDMLAGIVHGAAVSLQVGVFATFLGLLIGVSVGAVAGYFGGWTDVVLSRVTEVFQTLPNFVMLVVVVAIAQPSIATLSVAIAIVTWPGVARLSRAEFRTLREKDFVLAARSLGFGHVRIIVSEILPSALPPIIVTASVMVASAILMESALSFMGLGDPNVVSWGSMIGAGREYLRTAWYMCALPGFAIMLTVLALNLLGDALNEILNPRRQVRR
ncbi:ABC transporter permease [Novosphingobium guangzhouense]|uniref:ABC transporter permease n=1 Tax=Novosphingobium guangzhouense TaxID=1850347 RepID=A0A2K2G3B5_9SPHN|nr:ABC transporter permease [Novosphingobium guangzhouense]